MEKMIISKQPAPPPAAPAQPSASDLVEQALDQAVVTTIKNDEKVQSEILDGANQIIHNKTNALKTQAKTEEKAAHFNNKKNACECFGYNETTTEKWAVSLMGIWHSVITALWILIGMVTFAPVTFVFKKLSVMIKTTWLAILIAVAIYTIAATSPIWLRWLSK